MKVVLLFILVLGSCQTLSHVGASEWVELTELKNGVEARVDTGAALSSLGVSEVVPSKSGEKVFFLFEGRRYCLPIVRKVYVRHLGATQLRYTVELTGSVGNLKRKCEWSLTDRSSMEFQALLGRNWLEGLAVVNVSKGRS